MKYKTIEDAIKDGWKKIKDVSITNSDVSLYIREGEAMFDYELLNAAPLPIIVMDGIPKYFKDAHQAALYLLGKDSTRQRVWINVPILDCEFTATENRIKEALEKTR